MSYHKANGTHKLCTELLLPFFVHVNEFQLLFGCTGQLLSF